MFAVVKCIQCLGLAIHFAQKLERLHEMACHIYGQVMVFVELLGSGLVIFSFDLRKTV